MLEFLKNASAATPILLYGPPGIGKTEMVRQHFDYTEVMLASTMVEEDLAGLPYRDGDYDYRTIPSVFRNLQEADKVGTSCLFLDELDKSRRSVADTLLTLVASRKIGRGELPDNTVIIAAANPPEFGGGDGISDAMRSRFCVVEAEPNVAQWCEWANANFTEQSALSIIEHVGNGQIPLVDFAGEEMQKRITCPRTLTMILRHIEMKGADTVFVKKLADGLLTANTASRLMMALREPPRDYDVAHKSHSVRTSVSVKSKAPIRL